MLAANAAGANDEPTTAKAKISRQDAKNAKNAKKIQEKIKIKDENSK
jgi:hypothetical protein